MRVADIPLASVEHARPDDVFRPTPIGLPTGEVSLLALWRRDLVVTRGGFVVDSRCPWGIASPCGIPVRTRISVGPAREIVSREIA